MLGDEARTGAFDPGLSITPRDKRSLEIEGVDRKQLGAKTKPPPRRNAGRLYVVVVVSTVNEFN
jgi:hypothetical protein